jgi:hypothetical protein
MGLADAGRGVGADGITSASARVCFSYVQRQPDWLFLSSWNEFIAQPQVAPQRSMGLETDASVGNLAFVVCRRQNLLASNTSVTATVTSCAQYTVMPRQ